MKMDTKISSSISQQALSQVEELADNLNKSLSSEHRFRISLEYDTCVVPSVSPFLDGSPVDVSVQLGFPVCSYKTSVSITLNSQVYLSLSLQLCFIQLVFTPILFLRTSNYLEPRTPFLFVFWVVSQSRSREGLCIFCVHV